MANENNVGKNFLDEMNLKFGEEHESKLFLSSPVSTAPRCLREWRNRHPNPYRGDHIYTTY